MTGKKASYVAALVMIAFFVIVALWMTWAGR